jgi:hypothetical protein
VAEDDDVHRAERRDDGVGSRLVVGELERDEDAV